MIEADQKYVRIPLTQGKFAIIDAEDLPEIGKYRWSYSGGRAVRKTLPSDPVSTSCVKMHRQIMGFPDGSQIDHIDGNQLNNSRSNLRLATQGQNQQNKGPRKDSTTGFKGVFIRKMKHGVSWYAEIRIDGKSTYLGSFDSPEKASEAYRAKAEKVWGEFAKTEHPTVPDSSHLAVAPEAPRTNLTSSGYQGVYAHRRKWKAMYSNIYLGLFPTPELASAAVEAKIKELRQ